MVGILLGTALKPLLQNAPLKQNLLNFLHINVINPIQNKVEIKSWDELEDLQSKVKQTRLVEKLGKKGFHYDKKDLFEPITKVLTDSNQKLLEHSISTTKQLKD